MQQRVEIIKVLFREAQFLVFDEPTAVLTPQEVQEFFGIVRSLRDAGKGIVFITHKLGEVLQIADRITVLRDGRSVGEAMPGRGGPEPPRRDDGGPPRRADRGQGRRPQPGEAVLEVADLVVLDEREHPAVNGVSFQVRAGEIVGIAGVQGNGQTELVRALTGMRAPRVRVDQGCRRGSGRGQPRNVHKLGVAHVPEDRLRHGLVTSFTVAENMVLDCYFARPYSRGIVMNWGKIREEARRLVEQFDVRTPSIEVKAANLSGGNQQKVIVAREFGRPDVTLAIASQPTRGPGCGLHRVHPQPDRGPARPGAAILIVSSELDEVMALSDRLLVMYRGQVVAELDPKQVTPADVGLYMAGAKL